MNVAKRPVRNKWISLVLCAALSGIVACQPQSVTSGNSPVAIRGDNVFDRAAVQQGIESGNYRTPGSSAFAFQVFFALQNASGGDISFTAVVDGSLEARQMIPANFQGIVVVGGLTCPRTISFRNFVTTNAYTMQNIDLVHGERTSLSPEASQQDAEASGGQADPLPTFACPAIIVLVFKSNRVEGVVLDRDLEPVADPGSETIVEITGTSSTTNLTPITIAP